MSETATYQRPESFTVPEGGLASFLTATTGDWADDDNNSIPSSGIAQAKQAAEKLSEFGRYEDTYMVHAAEGETVIPTAIFDENPRLKESLFRQMREMGLEPESYVVGSDLNSINPVTGQPEFFFKKLFKGIKKAVKGVVKVFKKIAPIVLPIALAFTPLGPIYGAMAGAGIGSLIQGKSIGKSLKSALIAGAGAGLMTGLSGGLQGMGTGGVGFGKGFTSGVGNALSSPGARVANLFNPSADQFGTKFLNPNTAVEGVGPAGNFSAGPVQATVGQKLDQPFLDANLTAAEKTFYSQPGVNQPFTNLSAAEKAYYNQLRPDQVNFPASIKPTGLNTSGLNTTAAPTGAGESRNFLQRTGDYLTGGSPADLAKAKEVARNTYLANTPTNLQSAEGLAKAVADAGPGMLRKYGPSAAIGTGVFSLAGGFKVPEEEEVDLGPTGQELYDANPEQYGYMSDLSYLNPYNAPSNNAYRPTMFAAKGGNAVAFPRRIGGISGPGTGTSDDVPAMLSDGEFVMTADAVRGAGGGNRQRGINNMYSMMRRFEGGLV
tara:strand:- start:648 stop:2291 length:1644 start_codon:yes stop_codon:yes gene_type:complete